MRKKARLWTVILCIGAVILLIAALRVSRLNHDESPGRQLLKTQSSYTLDIQQMNGTDSHMLHLTAGDVLRVEFETEKGSLHMEITAPDGTVIYAGNGEETTDFEISIPETGAYAVTVEARRAQGKIHIRLKESSKQEHRNPSGSQCGSAGYRVRKAANAYHKEKPANPVISRVCGRFHVVRAAIQNLYLQRKKNQIEAQQSGFDLERRSSGMSAL